MANSDTPIAAPITPIDEDAPGPPISVPDSGDTGEGGKIKMIVQLVKKCLGVKDIAAMFVCSLLALVDVAHTCSTTQAVVPPCLLAGTNTKLRVLALPRQARHLCCVEFIALSPVPTALTSSIASTIQRTHLNECWQC